MRHGGQFSTKVGKLQTLKHPYLMTTAGLPDFCWYNLPKTGKNIPNDYKMYQMAVPNTYIPNCQMYIERTNFSHSKAFRNLSKLGLSV
jgi:hypothetical protein